MKDITDKEQDFDTANEEIVAFLYKKLGPAALSKTMRLVRKPGVAEDVVQDVFISMWHKKPVFPNLRSAYAWVYRSCTNKSIDYLRAKAQQNVSLDDVEVYTGSDSTTEQSVLSKELIQQVFKGMSEKEVSMVIYKYFEGLSQEEISEVMAISRSTVARLQSKIEKKISKMKESRNVG